MMFLIMPLSVKSRAQPGPVIALRADIDALPIHETTGLPFASENDGVMHACGHDSHIAILLGTAAILQSIKDQLHGTVKPRIPAFRKRKHYSQVHKVL